MIFNNPEAVTPKPLFPYKRCLCNIPIWVMYQGLSYSSLFDFPVIGINSTQMTNALIPVQILL